MVWQVLIDGGLGIDAEIIFVGRWGVLADIAGVLERSEGCLIGEGVGVEGLQG